MARFKALDEESIADVAAKGSDYLTRRALEYDLLTDASQLGSYQDVDGLRYVRLRGVSDAWRDSPRGYADGARSLLSGITAEGTVLHLVVQGGVQGMECWLGTQEELLLPLLDTYRACFPGAGFAGEASLRVAPPASLPYGGIMMGIPREAMEAGQAFSASQMDYVLRGVIGMNFRISIVAVRSSGILADAACSALLEEQMRASAYAQSNAMVDDVVGSHTVQFRHYDVERYLTMLEENSAMYGRAVTSGMWGVSGFYAADSEAGAGRLAGLLRAGLGTGCEETTLEPFRCIAGRGEVMALAQRPTVLAQYEDDKAETLLGSVRLLDGRFHRFRYRYQTLMGAEEASILFRPPTVEQPGYYVDRYVTYDSAARVIPEKPFTVGEVEPYGRYASSPVHNPYQLELDDFTRHALVVGITGGGKTNTIKQMLQSLWLYHNVSVLVIESAKREYWELMNIRADRKGYPVPACNSSFAGMKLFTMGGVGGRNVIEYRLNPFEVVEETPLQTHIDFLLSGFNASFDMEAPMPVVLEAAVYALYEDYGWRVDEPGNRYGLTVYPTLTALYHKISAVADSLGYEDRVRDNIKAALRTRINSLRVGGKGRMLDTVRSYPIEALLDRPAVLELEDIGDDRAKAFVMSLLLIQLYEYRASAGARPGGNPLRHVLVIEEAHRLLKKTTERTDAAAEQAVTFFCNMLAEIRTYGQGIVIADQIPTKLAPDTIKNTNLKIIHRTVMEDDRNVVGRAMNMSEEQIESLSTLPRGCAAVFSEGDSRPRHVRMPLVSPAGRKTRTEALEEVRAGLEGGGVARDERHHVGCNFCDAQGCAQMRARIARLRLERNIEEIESQGKKMNDATMAAWVEELIRSSGLPVETVSRLCIYGHLASRTKGSEENLMRAITRYIHRYCGKGAR